MGPWALAPCIIVPPHKVVAGGRSSRKVHPRVLGAESARKEYICLADRKAVVRCGPSQCRDAADHGHVPETIAIDYGLVCHPRSFLVSLSPAVSIVL